MGWKLWYFTLHLAHSVSNIFICLSITQTNKKNDMQNYKQQKANSVLLQPLITNFFFFCPHVILHMHLCFQVYICCNPPPHITGLISAYGIELMFLGFNSTFISVYTVMLSKDFCLNSLCSGEFPFFPPSLFF